jgi:hypothetical protein
MKPKHPSHHYEAWLFTTGNWKLSSKYRENYMYCGIWGFHSGDYEVCRVRGCSAVQISLPWRWRPHVPPKRRFSQDLHGATFQKTAYFNDVYYLCSLGAFMNTSLERSVSTVTVGRPEFQLPATANYVSSPEHPYWTGLGLHILEWGMWPGLDSSYMNLYRFLCLFII